MLVMSQRWQHRGAVSLRDGGCPYLSAARRMVFVLRGSLPFFFLLLAWVGPPFLLATSPLKLREVVRACEKRQVRVLMLSEGPLGLMLQACEKRVTYMEALLWLTCLVGLMRLVAMKLTGRAEARLMRNSRNRGPGAKNSR